MKWYVAKIVFKICSPGMPQFDEHLRLIQAVSFEEALLKSRRLGISEEDSFLNTNSQTVRWEFVNVADLHPIAELKDGVELYSCIREQKAEECTSYIRAIHQRAYDMQVNEMPEN